MPEASKIRCIFDLRDVPPSAFLLPGEKESNRQWRHNCEHRLMLLNYLATFADADGGNVRPAVDRMATRHEVSRRTIFRYLDDLKTLGFISSGKLTGFKGTRNRAINVAAVLKAAAVVPSSPSVVPSSQEQLCHLRPAVVPSSPSVVPSSRENIAETREDGTQPSLQTVKDIPPSNRPSYEPAKNGSGGGSEETLGATAPNPATMMGEEEPNRTLDEKLESSRRAKWLGWDDFAARFPIELQRGLFAKGQQDALKHQVLRYTQPIVLAAIKEWVQERKLSPESLDFPWSQWLIEGGAILIRRQGEQDAAEDLRIWNHCRVKVLEWATKYKAEFPEEQYAQIFSPVERELLNKAFNNSYPCFYWKDKLGRVQRMPGAQLKCILHTVWDVEEKRAGRLGHDETEEEEYSGKWKQYGVEHWAASQLRS